MSLQSERWMCSYSSACITAAITWLLWEGRHVVKLTLKLVFQNDEDFVDVILLYTEMGLRNTPFVIPTDL